jgi:hypothetical protein
VAITFRERLRANLDGWRPEIASGRHGEVRAEVLDGLRR